MIEEFATFSSKRPAKAHLRPSRSIRSNASDDAVSRKRTPKQKLLGWSILAVAALVIVGVFLITRIITSPLPAGTTTAQASSAPAVVSSAPSSAAAPSPATVTASQPAESTPRVALVDTATMDQQSRREMLLRLINQGVFTGIQAVGSPPRVGVTPLFKGLDPAMQREFVGLVYAYVNNGTTGTEPLQIVDAQTGDAAGTYTADAGLKLL
jgi:hypothetical protein